MKKKKNIFYFFFYNTSFFAYTKRKLNFYIKIFNLINKLIKARKNFFKS
jgi:hypothetical protein